MPPKKPVAAAKPAARPAAGRGAAAKPAAAAKKPAGKPAPAAAKKGAAPAKGAPAKGAAAKAAPPVKKWTPEDEAASKIQKSARKYIARKELERKKKEKQDYEELMDKLEKEAFVKIIKMQQEEEERKMAKENEERQRKREAAKRIKRMLEAAFDGDVDDMAAILKEVSDLDDKMGIGKDEIGQALRNRHINDMICCEDPNENTALSEAGSGGHKEAIVFLIDRGADPNTKGQFGRSPLYRAAFAGHLEAVETLLQNGADPRVYADDSQTPEQVSSLEAVKNVLSEWDVGQTDKLLEKLEGEKERRREEDRKRREAEQKELEGELVDVERQYKTQQLMVIKCTEELEKRIYEHDHAISEGFENKDLLVQVINDAEMQLEIAKVDLEKARDKLYEARLKLREKENEGEGGEENRPGIKVMIKELDEVLLRDVGNKIKDSGKWPLIIDPSTQAATFLRYRDVNYVNALRPKDMEPEAIRMAVLGAIRFGKPLVLDMMQVDMFDTCVMKFNDTHPNLMEMIMDKSIMKEENYLKLKKTGDGDQYDKNKFVETHTERFALYIVTKNPYPSTELLDKTYPISVYVAT